MAQKPNLHGLQNYSLRSGKYAIDPNAKSRKDGGDLLKWLVDHDFDPFDGFRFAETETKEEWIEYSYDPEEDGDDPNEAWEDYLNSGDFLFIRDDREEVVKSW